MQTPSILEIDALIEKSERALTALTRDRADIGSEIRERLAFDDETGAATLRAEAEKLDQRIATEQDRLAGLKDRRDAAVVAEADAERQQQLAVCRDLAAARVDAAGKIDAAVAKLGKAVAALTILSADLDKAVRAMPKDVRPLQSRTDDDVFPGLAASLIKSGLPHLFPDVRPGTGDRRTLAERTRATADHLSRIR